MSERADGLDLVREIQALDSEMIRDCLDTPGDVQGPEAEPWPTVRGYEILGKLGAGGMGVVYRARQIEANRIVALKMIRRDAGLDGEVLKRFRRESQTLARFHHPGIVQVFEVGDPEGPPFFSMEYCSGGDLGKRLQAGPLPVREAAQLAEKLARAVQEAHAVGVIHRDLKPLNILFAGGTPTDAAAASSPGPDDERPTVPDARPGLDQPKISDFGLARQLDEPGLTHTGMIMGTPEYMAPEQASGQPTLGSAVDVWALGVILYRCLTGECPFQGASPLEVPRQVQESEPKSPRQLNPKVSLDLATICLKCLQKDPRQRYASAKDLADDLSRYLNNEPILARPVGKLERAWRWAQRNRGKVVTGALVLVLAVVTVGLIRAESARQQAREKEQDKQMLRRLEEAGALRFNRIQGGGLEDMDHQGADRAIREAFKDYGIDVDVLSAREAAREIRKRTLAVELAAALDELVIYRKTRPELQLGDWKHILEIAQGADPDDLRNEVRAALVQGAPHALQELARKLDVERLPPTTLVLLDRVLGGAKKYEDALILLRQAQSHHPEHFALNYQLALQLLQMTPPRPEEAVRSAQAALALRSDCYFTHHTLGNALCVKGDNQEAIACYKEALRLKKDDYTVHLNLGYVLHLQNELDKASRCYQEAIRLKPECHEAYNNLGNILVDKGDIDAGVNHYKEAIRLKPSYANAYNNLCEAMLEKRDTNAAIAAGQQAIHLKRDFPMAHYNLGNALFRKGDWDGAIARFQEAIHLKPDYHEAYCNLGSARHNKGDRDGAIACFQKAIRFKQDAPAYHYDLGNVLLEKGKLEGASSSFQEAIRLKPDYPEAHFNLGNALYVKGDTDGAITCYLEAIRLKEDYADAHFNLGVALRRKGKLDAAIASYREAIRLNKDYPNAHFSLGNALMDKVDQDAAIASYREATRRKPNFAEAQCSLGLALEKQDQFPEALQWLRSGHQIGSKSPNWNRPSAAWVARCEHLLELDRRLPALLEGKDKPASTAERLELARLCMPRQLFAGAARFYSEAFQQDARLADAFGEGHRHNAAIAAVLAGTGIGKDVPDSAMERARLRRQALDWLRPTSSCAPGR